MSFEETKKPLKSKGVIGALIALVAGVGQIVTENSEVIPVFGDIAPIVTVAGSLLALIGRIFANTSIKLF